MLPPKSILAERLQHTLKDRNMNTASLARAADVKTSFLYDVLSSKSRNPSTITLARVAAALDVSLPYLIGSEPISTVASKTKNRQGDYIIAEPLAIETEAGRAVLASSMASSSDPYLSRHWIESTLGCTPANLRSFSVSGDAMQPSLQDGDAVLIDTASTQPSPAGLFVLFDGVGLVVKRVELAGNEVHITSDNPSYAATTAPLGEVQIIGRVVWFGRIIV